MPLDSKQQIFNALEIAFLNYLNFDLKNNFTNIYEYMDSLENVIKEHNIIDIVQSYMVPFLGPNPLNTRVVFKAELDSTGYPIRNIWLEFYTEKILTHMYRHIGNSSLVNYDEDKHFMYIEFGNPQYSFVVCYHLKDRNKSYLLVTKYEYESVLEKHELGNKVSFVAGREEDKVFEIDIDII